MPITSCSSSDPNTRRSWSWSNLTRQCGPTRVHGGALTRLLRGHQPYTRQKCCTAYSHRRREAFEQRKRQHMCSLVMRTYVSALLLRAWLYPKEGHKIAPLWRAHWLKSVHFPNSRALSKHSSFKVSMPMKSINSCHCRRRNGSARVVACAGHTISVVSSLMYHWHKEILLLGEANRDEQWASLSDRRVTVLALNHAGTHSPHHRREQE